jgi:hypothetical protein
MATKWWITTIASTVTQNSLVKVCGNSSYDICGCIYMYNVLPYSIYCILFQRLITYKQQTMLSIDCMQHSTNYHTRGCILVEELFPYNILRSCPTTLAVTLTCSHLNSLRAFISIVLKTQNEQYSKLKWSLLALNWYPVTHNSSTDYKLCLCKQITNMTNFCFRKVPYFLETYVLLYSYK